MERDKAVGREINGIDIQAFQESVRAVAAVPEAKHAPKKSRVRWLGGLKVRAYVRNHAFLVDEPPHLTGEDEAPNAMEYVLGALGACLVTGFVLDASKQGIELYNVEVVLDSTQDNVFTFLGLSEEGHSGFNGIVAKLYVQADADEETLKLLWEHTLRTSPVGNSLTREVPLKPELIVVQ